MGYVDDLNPCNKKHVMIVNYSERFCPLLSFSLGCIALCNALRRLFGEAECCELNFILSYFQNASRSNSSIKYRDLSVSVIC